MDPQLLNFIPFLRCPISGQKLEAMTTQSLDKLNEAIRDGKATTYEGESFSKPVKEALLSGDGKYSYPVIEGYIAALLPNTAILTEKIDTSQQGVTFSSEKKSVQQFYDDFGWQKTEEGYNDTITFEDRRPVSEKYWSKCHLRLNKYLPGGTYLLDVASGSVPNDEYLSFSDRYAMRICMDFSIQAMKEAASRLKGKGIFIQGDMTALPIADNCIDSVISMHTVYHIPQQEQTKAVKESFRILKPGGQSVIVYNWPEPMLMRMAFGIWRPIIGSYKRLKGIKRKENKSGDGQTAGRPELFLQKQGYEWFARDIQEPYEARLEVYSAISRSFSNTFIREKAFGRQLSGFIYRMENLFPAFLGRWGQYPVFLIRKMGQPARFKADRETMSLKGTKTEKKATKTEKATS